MILYLLTYIVYIIIYIIIPEYIFGSDRCFKSPTIFSTLPLQKSYVNQPNLSDVIENNLQPYKKDNAKLPF